MLLKLFYASLLKTNANEISIQGNINNGTFLLYVRKGKLDELLNEKRSKCVLCSL